MDLSQLTTVTELGVSSSLCLQMFYCCVVDFRLSSPLAMLPCHFAGVPLVVGNAKHLAAALDLVVGLLLVEWLLVIGLISEKSS
jgi:hypothetical protein